MSKSRKRNLMVTVIVAVLILFAYVLRLPFEIPLPFPLVHAITITRSAVYVALFGVWGISVGQRVIDFQVRWRFVAIASLMVFWIVVRCVKYMLPADSDLGRYCWYTYYIPMLGIPLLASTTALFMGRAEGWRPPRASVLLYVAAALIALFVLTNDFHHLVFVFPEGMEAHWDSQYRYGLGFLAPVIWRYGGLIATLVIVVQRSRLPNRGQRVLAPLVPALLLVVYSTFYVLGSKWIVFFLGDLAVTESLLIICILEAVLGTGLIQSNTHYMDLFSASGSGALIVDYAGDVIARADNSLEAPLDLMEQSHFHPVMLDGKTRLSSAAITDGHVYWSEDVSQLMETMEELAGVQSFLQQRTDVAQREMDSAKRRHQAAERKNLYDSVVLQSAPEIQQLDDLISSLALQKDSDKVRFSVLQITVICAYIKRKISLIFQAMDDGEVSGMQLDACICKDLLPCLCAGGAVGEYVSDFAGWMPVSSALMLYDAFFQVSMHCLPSLQSIQARLTGKKDAPILEMELVCGQDLSSLSSACMRVQKEGALWKIQVAGQPAKALESA